VKPVMLIAVNFLREHRWPVLIMFAWIGLTALAAAGFGRDRVGADDVVFYVQQQAIYICVFSAFLAADAIHNERKSRRILLVLSKAISRGEYLLAVILGTCAMAFAYTVMFGLCGVWLAGRAALPSGEIWSVVVLVMAGSVLASTVALFFATFLNPYVATALTLVGFSAPALLHAQHHAWFVWLPGLPVLFEVLRFSFHSGWLVNWMAAAAAIVQSVFFWAVAAAIFDRRDIAVPVE
jgi:ABC-type transport system involved in multi-copper enzyme maturation permease subunit